MDEKLREEEGRSRVVVAVGVGSSSRRSCSLVYVVEDTMAGRRTARRIATQGSKPARLR